MRTYSGGARPEAWSEANTRAAENAKRSFAQRPALRNWTDDFPSRLVSTIGVVMQDKRKYVAVYHDGTEIELVAPAADVMKAEQSSGAFILVGDVLLATINLRYIRPVAD